MSPPPTPEICGSFFLKKLCMGKQTSLGKFMGRSFTWELMIRSCKREKSTTNAFSSNLNIAILKIFPGHGGRGT